MEELNKIVGAILKSLECSICLELLKSPVSVGCGHFFCKNCISNFLGSSYRESCPLCKRSFTRRGVQEATQRDSIICASKRIAESCQKLTGFSFFSRENSRETSLCGSKCVEESAVPDSSEKIKISFLKAHVTKKRKSSEKDPDAENINKCVEHTALNSADNDTFQIAKKLHFQPEDVEENEFPSLENLLEESVKPAEVDNCASEQKKKEHVSVVLPKERDGMLKKYSKTKYHSSTSENLFKMLKAKGENEKVAYLDETTSKENALPSIFEQKAHSSSQKMHPKNIVIKRKIKSNLRNLKLKDRTNIKNVINALKNKTDLVDSLTKEDIIKVKDSKDKLNASIVKENENSILLQNVSSTSTPVKALPAKKRGRPKKIKITNSTEEETINQVPKDKEISSHNKKGTENTELDSLPNECYNLNEISLTDSSVLNNDQIKNSNLNVKVLLQDVCLPDTAVSVHSITSPPANKSVSFYKSPGWTRVKQDGKDFRFKTFSALHVAKNPPGFTAKDVSNSVENDITKCTKAKFVQVSHASRSEVNEKEFDKPPNCSAVQKNDINVCERNFDKQKENETIISERYSQSEKNSENGSNSSEVAQLKENILKCDDKNVEQNVHSIESVPKSMQCTVKLIKMNLGSHTRSNEMCKENLVQDLNCSTVINETLSKLPESTANENLNETEASFTNNIDDESNMQEAENMNLNPNESQALIENFETTSNNVHLQKVTELLQPLEEKKEAHLMPVLERIDNVENNELMQIAEVDDLGDDLKFLESINSIIVNKSPNHNADAFVEPNRSAFIAKSESISHKHEDDVVFLEHSQQTSQSLFNYNVEKDSDVCNAVIQKTFLKYSSKQCHNAVVKYPALPNMNPWICTITNLKEENPVSKAEKTKVLKRTCLTLEEIQDAFLKSSLSGQTESICSIPFLAGEFKLNISVAEETLNVSVVKVINEASGNDSLCMKNLISEKGIQTSACHSPTCSPASIIPSSNAESEASLLDHSDKIELEKCDELFPYLSEKPLKKQSSVKSSSLTASEAQQMIESVTRNLYGNAWDNVHNEEDTETELEHSKPDCFKNEDYIHLNATTVDIPKKQDLNEIHLQDKASESSNCDGKILVSNVSTSNNIQKNELDKNAHTDVEKSSTIHNKCKLNFGKRASEEQLSDSDHSSEDFDPFEGNSKNFRISASVPISDDSDNFSSDPDMAYASKLVAPLKNLAKKKRMLEKKGIAVNDGGSLANNSENSNVKLPIFSKDNSAMDSSAATCKEPSRLSRKLKNSHKKFKRIQKSCESSDESETDEKFLIDHTMKKDSSNAQDQTKFFQSPKSNLPSAVQDKQDTVETLSTAPNEIMEEHCTLNSILSDEIKDADANDIVMEIGDLDRKIKMIEAKLKQCGHAEALQQNCNLSKSKEPNFVHKDENNGDDNEDSIDLFTESIPPTPPEALS